MVFVSKVFGDVSFFFFFSKVRWCCVFLAAGSAFITENVEENEQWEGKEERERYFRQSVPPSACFGNSECV